MTISIKISIEDKDSGMVSSIVAEVSKEMLVNSKFGIIEAVLFEACEKIVDALPESYK